jgi:hypothetical protein
MAIDQVEDLPVSARERIERCPDPPVADRVTAGQRAPGGPVISNVVISGVKEGESFSEIPGRSGRLRRSARSGPGPIAVQAFPAAEREQPGPHAALVLQTSGQGVAGNQGDLSGACGTSSVAEKTETVVEEVPGMLVEHLGERVPIALFWPRMCWAQRRRSLSLTCHRTPSDAPPPVPGAAHLLPPVPLSAGFQFKQGVLDGSGCNIPWPVFAMRPAAG